MYVVGNVWKTVIKPVKYCGRKRFGDVVKGNVFNTCLYGIGDVLKTVIKPLKYCGRTLHG